jgi:L-alanine-DL-glutamate epimerase-like enolase superfamily enzyme
VQAVILRLTTRGGLQGIGESDPHPGFAAESPESVMQLIRQRIGPAVLGMEAGNLVALHQRMDQAIMGNPFAKAPFDLAAHDLLGKALNVPAYQLLGGALRDRVPMIWPIGGGTPADNAGEVLSRLDEGYGSFHVKVGALAPEVDLARVRAIREAAGPAVPLMIDANQAWDRSTAIRIIRRLEAYDPSMVEQPVPGWDVEGMAQVQAAVGLPISADEAIDSTHKAVEIIRRDAARVFSLKHGKMGGLLRARQIAAMAEAAGIACFVNSMIELGISVAASLHLAATVPNLVDHGHALMSNLRMKSDILVPGSFQYDGRDILVPQQGAGLGVAIDEDELRRRAVDSFVLSM